MTPLVVLDAIATGALDAEVMGYAPVVALRKLFAQTGATPDAIECNEAFAA